MRRGVAAGGGEGAEVVSEESGLGGCAEPAGSGSGREEGATEEPGSEDGGRDECASEDPAGMEGWSEERAVRQGGVWMRGGAPCWCGVCLDERRVHREACLAAAGVPLGSQLEHVRAREEAKAEVEASRVCRSGSGRRRTGGGVAGTIRGGGRSGCAVSVESAFGGGCEDVLRGVWRR